MFDPAARLILEEMLGYERFVLAECGDAIRTARGKSGPVRLLINDSPPHMPLLSITDTIGDTGAGLVKKMSPLVFTASFKLIDMLMEWTINENGISCPFQFDKKINIIDTNLMLHYPDFLGTDTAVRETAIALYKEITPYRNAIVHNRWGQVHDGILDFDFHRKGGHFKKAITFDEVLALADIAELLGTMLVNQSADQHKLDSLRFLFNKIGSLHRQPHFAISQPRFFQVIRRTKMPQSGYLELDLDGIKAHVHQNASGKPATFDLMVVGDTAPRPVVWKIPFAEVPANTSIVLDEAWDHLRVDASKELKSLEPFLRQGEAAESKDKSCPPSHLDRPNE